MSVASLRPSSFTRAKNSALSGKRLIASARDLFLAPSLPASSPMTRFHSGGVRKATEMPADARQAVTVPKDLPKLKAAVWPSVGLLAMRST